MLPATNRLKGDRNFSRLKKHGRVYHSKLITLKIVKNGLDKTRFAFVVSTKAEKSAVKRNRLKRQLREIIRLMLAKFQPGYDVIISGKKAAIGAPYNVLEGTIIETARKTPILAKFSEKPD